MIDQEKFDTIFQIVASIEDGVLTLEKRFEAKDSQGMEEAKKSILELQKKLAAELNKARQNG